ncbi:hypothetical protein Clacol_001127 [Clathrus columnatus]|uniref:Peptidase A1 domain-containing protein n=1 Tax=Clathrus columnatus TaxID=1419009 RepID=A0AAV4ZXP1_9AGAM|nr:hypothetical protein Clacol_001127 [Clathrus columnatus]
MVFFNLERQAKFSHQILLPSVHGVPEEHARICTYLGSWSFASVIEFVFIVYDKDGDILSYAQPLITIISALPVFSPNRATRARNRKIARDADDDSSSFQGGISVPLDFDTSFGSFTAPVQLGNNTPTVLDLTVTTLSGLVVITQLYVADDTTELTNQTLRTVVGGTGGIGLGGIGGQIQQEVVGFDMNFPVSLNPEDAQAVGQVTYGGIDSTKFCGDLQFIPRGSKDKTIQNLWSADATDVVLGNTSLVSNGVPFYVDVGTTQIQLPTALFEQYVGITGASVDDFGFLHYNVSQAANMPDLSFVVGNVTLTVPGPAQLVPKQLNSAPAFGINFTSDDFIGLVLERTSEAVLISQPLLIEYYSVFDFTNNRMGFAQSVNSIRGCPQ